MASQSPMMSFKGHLTVNSAAALAAVSLSYLLKFLLFRHLTELDLELTTRQSVLSIMVNAGAAIFLGGLTLLIRRNWAVILLMLLTDIWLLFNIIYFCANGILPDWQVITLAPQLHGFETSLLAFLHWQQALFPLITFATALFLYALNSGSSTLVTPWFAASMVMTVGILMQTIGVLANKSDYADGSKWNIRDDDYRFLKAHSPIGHAAYALQNSISEGLLSIKSITPLTTEEQRTLKSIIRQPHESAQPTGHLVYLLVESLETWALNATEISGKPVCPNLSEYINSHTVLYCPSVITQQQYGRSGDGQLITQTGLLPLKHGVACVQYGENTYPNLAHFYNNSVVITGYPKVWNQRVTTYSYGFKHLNEPRLGHKGSDKQVFQQLRNSLEMAKEPTCVLALTIDTHAPFKKAKHNMRFSGDYSSTEASYLECVHGLDSLIGEFLSWSDTAATMTNATIVITADHNHFTLREGKGLCPLIINSPTITQPITIAEAYQMDLFPTVLHAIGQQNYFWQGFGVDMININNPNTERTISPQTASYISDKLIRSNYFSTK